MPDSQSPSKQTVKPSAAPPVPTMTNATVIPSLEDMPRSNPRLSEELADDIVARPMTLPDFVNVPLANPTLAARWIFTDRRRFAQAKAQGWRVAQKRDVKPGYAALVPFEEEGGTKYINGDLILMVIDRKIYLGALRYKHQVAAALSDAAVQKRVTAQRAAHDMGETVAAVNRQRVAAGADPVMTVFAPGVADLNETVLGQPGVAGKEVGRLGNAARDTGSLADLANQVKGE
jgi:hypothetical protein